MIGAVMSRPPPPPDALWLPFTSNRRFAAEPRLFVRAEGLHLWNQRGQRLLDACSGLFCVALGHGRPEIRDAVARQLAELDYAPPFQFAHPGAFELAARVAELAPPGLGRVLFCNSGSEAVDTAMKVALLYQRARGQASRRRFVSRERSYHGVNLGGTALSGMVRNRAPFGESAVPVSHLRHTWLEANRFVPGQGEHGAELADDLEREVQLHGAEGIAACFVEPIAGSTGILVPPKGYLERLREICDRHGILLVFDEVICGFGRTGAPFGAQSFGVVPDVITVAKALTNGAVPMGAAIFRDEIQETVLAAAPEGAIELYHGYTYSGHPVACAAGLATLRIFREEGVFERAAKLAPYFQQRVFGLRDLPVVTDIRGYGLLAALDLAPAAEGWGERGHATLLRLFSAGLLTRITGDTVILAPALVAEREHVDRIVDTLREVLRRS
jgi:beta-alanine--pyruvate transaminase